MMTRKNILLGCFGLLCVGTLYSLVVHQQLDLLCRSSASAAGHTSPPAVVVSARDAAWWHNQDLTVWTVWIGSSLEDMPSSIATAVESCRLAHNDEDESNSDRLRYRIVTDADLQDPLRHLGFALHPSFHLLDSVEQSDYLRGELLHVHGGFYLDADMLCLTSMRDVLMRSSSSLVVGGGQDRTQYHPWPAFAQNAMGPVRPNTTVTQFWHDELHRTMDALTPQLRQCLEKHGSKGKLVYPKPRYHTTSMCGVQWGALIDFMKPLWMELAQSNQLGKDLHMCDTYGRYLGYDCPGEDRGSSCNVVHLGTAGPFFKKMHWTRQKMCKKLRVLRGHAICPRQD